MSPIQPIAGTVYALLRANYESEACVYTLYLVLTQQIVVLLVLSLLKLVNGFYDEEHFVDGESKFLSNS